MEIEHRTFSDCIQQYISELETIDSEPNPMTGSLTFNEALDVYLERLERLKKVLGAVDYVEYRLFSAIVCNDPSEVESLLKEGSDLNVQLANGWTPLMLAASKGHAEIVRILLTAGADYQLKDIRGDTALLIALYKGHLDVARYIWCRMGIDESARQLHSCRAISDGGNHVGISQ